MSSCKCLIGFFFLGLAAYPPCQMHFISSGTMNDGHIKRGIDRGSSSRVDVVRRISFH